MGKEKKDEREEGIEAIIALQKFVGIHEPREKAEKAWDSFNAFAREQTMLAFRTCCKTI